MSFRQVKINTVSIELDGVVNKISHFFCAPHFAAQRKLLNYMYVVDFSTFVNISSVSVSVNIVTLAKFIHTPGNCVKRYVVL